VDDVESVAEFIREVLLAFEHTAEISLSVEDALSRFEHGKYDLVVTDYNMPGMSGLEFAQAIRERSANQPILLITGDSFSSPIRFSEGPHFNATLQKPFTLVEFQETLSGIFSQSC
jgi:two-component system chemotaxis response regulator CheY